MADWTAGYCDVGGVEIHYRRTGGNKPALVLLHGYTDDGGCWTPWARVFASEWDVIMPDFRGHGLSSVPQEDITVIDLARDIIGLIETLQLDRPVVGGHSMGGITAAIVAAERPDLVRALVLEDPFFLTREAQPAPERRRSETRSASFENHKRMLKTPLEELIASQRKACPQWSDETIELWAQAKHRLKPEAFTRLADAAPDYREVVRKIQCPLLLVMGEKERGAFVTEPMAAHIKELCPAASYQKVEGAGHCIRYDRQDVFTALVQAYLRDLKSQSTF